jgi:hypothetical protein
LSNSTARTSAAASDTGPTRGLGNRVRALAYSGLAQAGVLFFLVACTFTYYGQLHRKQSGDVFGTIYTAVAIVEHQTIWLDRYMPYIENRAGEDPYMVRTGPGGHDVTTTPTASSVLALPVVAAFELAGARGEDWNAWMEASMLTAALTTAASVAVLFVLLTRLTTRRRAALIAATYAWGTLAWGVSGQALWQHGGAALALCVALLALVDRRFLLAGAAVTAMAAFRLTTPVMALFLLPLVGRRPRDWLRFALGALPFPLALLAYNTVAFGSPLEQGYGSSRITSSLQVHVGRILEGISGLLVSPGRGLFLYSPVLLFAIYGAIRGRREWLYRSCAAAFVAYVVVVANVSQWWGGECFGARKLAEALPLLAVLLVPAVDSIVGTRRLRLYLALLAVSVFVELLSAAAWPPGDWFGQHDLLAFSTWWSPVDNEIVAMLRASGTPSNLGLMALISLAGLAAGALSTALFAREARGRRVSTS